jgi:hypothetical protein
MKYQEIKNRSIEPRPEQNRATSELALATGHWLRAASDQRTGTGHWAAGHRGPRRRPARPRLRLAAPQPSPAPRRQQQPAASRAAGSRPPRRRALAASPRLRLAGPPQLAATPPRRRPHDLAYCSPPRLRLRQSASPESPRAATPRRRRSPRVEDLKFRVPSTARPRGRTGRGLAGSGGIGRLAALLGRLGIWAGLGGGDIRSQA